jgi:hypothetical protein
MQGNKGNKRFVVYSEIPEYRALAKPKISYEMSAYRTKQRRANHT